MKLISQGTLRNQLRSNDLWRVNKKYYYYIIFGITFSLFSLVQENIRPNYEGGNSLTIYFLGVIPNFLPGIGLPSFFYVTISEVFKPNSFFFKERLKLSIYISMIGLIFNEFITIFTPGRGIFDWNDILWTLIGGVLFLIIHRKINKV